MADAVGTRRRWLALAGLSWVLLLLAGVALRAAVGPVTGLPEAGSVPLPPRWQAPLVALSTAIAQADAAVEQAVRASVLVDDGPRRLLALLSRPGDGPVVAVVCLLGAAVLWRLGERGWAWRLPLAAALHGLLIRGIKAWVERPRPAHQDDGWVLVSGASFPSGHAACGLFVYGLLALLVWQLRVRRPDLPVATRRRAAVAAWAVLCIGLWAGMTRPLLLLHHASDLVAGWLLAAGMLALVWATRPSRPWPAAEAYVQPKR